MITILVAFSILGLAIYLGCQLLDLVINRFNLFSQRNSPQGDSGLSSDFTVSNSFVHSTNSCEIESVCVEASDHLAGLGAGIFVALESVGEHIGATVEGL